MQDGGWYATQVRRLQPLWAVCAVQVSGAGNFLAAAGLGGQLWVWNMQPGLEEASLQLKVVQAANAGI